MLLERNDEDEEAIEGDDGGYLWLIDIDTTCIS